MEDIIKKIIYYSLTIVPVLSLLFTVRYQYITNQISQIRKQRDDINSYGVELITIIYKYYRGNERYLTELNKMYNDINNDIDITERRSEFIYHLKDEYIKIGIELESIKQKITLELPNQIFPGIKSQVLQSIENIYDLNQQMKDGDNIEDINNFKQKCDIEINKLKNIFENVIDENTEELAFYSKMKLFKFNRKK